jgi:PTH2 family peptidyl-tRNA hydrolase
VKTKQVIVMRADLKMRRGKECAQAAHASGAFVFKQIKDLLDKDCNGQVQIRLAEAAKQWVQNSYTKVCCRVDSEQELLDIEAKAKATGLECHLITDNGLTEFGGVPTRTCLAIGPNESEKIDLVTGHLRLY